MGIKLHMNSNKVKKFFQANKIYFMMFISEMLIISLRGTEGLHRERSLQCRRFWWFSSFECLAAILDSLKTGRIEARMRECRSGFSSPQLSTVFLIQDGGLNIGWEYPLASPKSACTAGYRETPRKDGAAVIIWFTVEL